jgi:hypothetical protein
MLDDQKEILTVKEGIFIYPVLFGTVDNPKGRPPVPCAILLWISGVAASVRTYTLSRL